LNGLFKTTDGGASWKTLALLPNAWVNKVTIDPANPDTVYIATERYVEREVPGFYTIGFNGLFKTIDGGTSWVPINSGLPDLGSLAPISSFVIDADSSNILYAGTNGQGVFTSIDGGASWSAFNEGLSNLNIQSLALVPGAPNVLYAGTPRGIFKIVDDRTVLSLSTNGYCVTSSRSLTVSNGLPNAPIHLLGTSNGQAWEVADWRKTDTYGILRISGQFAQGTEGFHSLRVGIAGVISNLVSFAIARCTPG
jgi:hypothetical protein